MKKLILSLIVLSAFALKGKSQDASNVTEPQFCRKRHALK